MSAMVKKSYPFVKTSGSSWLNLNEVLGIPIGTPLLISNSGGGTGQFFANNIPPNNNTIGRIIPRFSDSLSDVVVSEGSETIWIRGSNALISVHTLALIEPPEGLYSGLRAMTVQGYEEANIKLGVQFEGSKNFGELAGGTVLNTIFRTGDLPVALKKRLVSFTGTGVTGEIFINPTYTGGINEVYQNGTSINPQIGLSQILVNLTSLEDTGTLAFAPVHAFGNASNQGKGGVLTLIEPEHILAPNTDFLLRLTSLDNNPQRLASHLVWYEGNLDLPLL